MFRPRLQRARNAWSADRKEHYIMPRPLKPSSHLRQRFDLYLDEAELQQIRGHALAAGLPVSTFVRRSALRQKIAAAPHPTSVERWRQLASLAANLNQIAHACHLGRAPQDIGETIGALVEEVRLLRLELLTPTATHGAGGTT
jgi:hypothetical protein